MSNNIIRKPEEIVQAILQQRGIAQQDQASFLKPNFEQGIHDPLLMKGMQKAAVQIKKAIDLKQSIAIFGDYDADGVPATALLVRAFRRLGVEVTARIPTRAAGYGLTMTVVEELIALKINLLITVDNGTIAQAEVAALAEKGIDVIICDHHEPLAGHMADKALAILNPKQEDCQYPFKELCGCAIAWKLAWQLYLYLGKEVAVLKWDLDLVGLSTIADMVPLKGENRVLAYYGLKVLNKTKNKGLAALIKVAGLSDSIQAGQVSFALAPRINAPSRMHSEMQDNYNVALQLLVTEDACQASELALYLNQQNVSRQNILQEHLIEAQIQAEQFLDNFCLILYQKDWSTGLIGLLAGRMVEKFHRPVLVLASEDGVVKGSLRSIDGVEALDLLNTVSSYLERFGGHSKAAGLTMKSWEEGTLQSMRRKLHDWLVGREWTIEKLQQAHNRSADLSLRLDEINLELIEELKKLEPFGIGFHRPLFATGAQLTNLRRVGSHQQHLSCVLYDGVNRQKAIGFGMGDILVENGQDYLIYCNLDTEEWQNVVKPSCLLQRLEKA